MPRCAGSPSGGGDQYLKCQSTSHEAASNSNKSFSVTLKPSTATEITYEAKHYIDSYAEYGSKNANGSTIITDAWLNTLELVPAQ